MGKIGLQELFEEEWAAEPEAENAGPTLQQKVRPAAPGPPPPRRPAAPRARANPFWRAGAEGRRDPRKLCSVLVLCLLAND